MSSNGAKVALGVSAIVVAIVLLVVLKDGGGGDKPSNANAAVPVIVVEHGKPVGGVKSLTYSEGERIHFQVKSDIGDEIHVHGYDVTKDVEAGGSVTFDFPATLEGVFEAELEGRKEQIAEITVNP